MTPNPALMGTQHDLPGGALAISVGGPMWLVRTIFLFELFTVTGPWLRCKHGEPGCPARSRDCRT
jgi:hypothetical protein